MAAVRSGAAARPRRRFPARLSPTVGMAAIVALSAAACSGGSRGATPAGAAGVRVPPPSASSHPAPAASAPATPSATGTGYYVALGDSYTAGPGVPDRVGTPAGCDRSSRAYPELVAAGLGLAPDKFRSVACVGATTADLTGTEHMGGGNPPQFDALTPATTLVTLGIGGNDVDVVGVVISCLTMDTPDKTATNPDPAPCRSHFTSGGVDQLRQRIAATSGDVADALAQIAERAPHAKVYVVGYPDLVPADGTACRHVLDLTPDDVVFLHEQEVRLNTMLRDRAKAAGAVYVDTYTPSIGRDACSDQATRWVEPLVPAGSGTTLHPNIRGEQGMADAVLAAMKGSA